MKYNIGFILFFVSLSVLFFNSFANSQQVTDSRDVNLQSQIEKYIIGDIDSPGEILTDLRNYEESPLLDLQAAFLNLSDQQKEEYVARLKETAAIYSKINGLFYVREHAKTKKDKNDVDNSEKQLEDELKSIPQDLKNIFGDEIYARYFHFKSWEYYNNQNWSNESGKKEKEWEKIDSQNGIDLDGSEYSSPDVNRQILAIVYEDYKDFLEKRKAIFSTNARLTFSKGPFVDRRSVYVQQYLNDRKKRESFLHELIGNKKYNLNMLGTFELNRQ